MKIAAKFSSIILGMIFLIFGLNGLHTFIPMPEYHPFMEMMSSTGFLAVINLLEITGGLMLIVESYTLLSLLILGPIIFNILMYHVLIDSRNIVLGFVNLVLYVIVTSQYWHYFKVFLKSKPRMENL